MRQISDYTMAILSQTQGLEPINIVDIYWNIDNPTAVWRYSDRMLEGLAGRILELSNLENVVDITGNTNSQAVSLRIDDSDGSLKGVFDTSDIHKRRVTILQYFLGMPVEEAFIIFEGEISSPIVWKESDRTLSFQVLSKLEDQEIGFSVEEGDFDAVPQNLMGVAWPMIFGTVIQMKPIRVDEMPAFVTTEPVGIKTPLTGEVNTVNNNIAQSLASAQDNATQAYQAGNDLQTQASNLKNSTLPGQFDSVAKQWQDLQDQAQDAFKQANDYMAQYFKILSDNVKWVAPKDDPNDPKNLLDQKKEIGLIGADRLGQNSQSNTAILKINEATYVGNFTPSGFKILNKTSPYTEQPPTSGPVAVDQGLTTTEYSNKLQEDLSFWFAFGGTTAQCIQGISTNYLVSMFDVSINSVYAYRTLDGSRVLMPLPFQYWQKRNHVFGPINSTWIHIPNALSGLGEGWEDDLLCDVTCAIGPNVVDILIHLILNYTQHGYDQASFVHVRARVDFLPANFILTKRINIVQALQEIAFQARCAIWYSNGLFYIKYLAEEVDPVDTISESDVEFGSMSITCTETEDLVTKLTATWRPTPEEADYKIIYRHNVRRYGTHEQSFNFYIYNQQSYVEFAAIFWLIRKANTWKRIHFDTFLTKMKLEPFDTILLNFTRSWVANGPVPAIVEKVVLDTSTLKVSIQCWVPVRLGEMTQYPFAMPADIIATYIFPTLEAVNSGDAGGNGPGKDAVGTIPNNDVKPQNHTINQKKKQSDQGPGASIADSNVPQITTQLLTTTPFIVKGVKPGDDANATKSKQYQVQKYVKPTAPLPSVAVYPGIVQDKDSGKNYKVSVYFNGLNNDPTIITVRQLAIRDDDTINPGTPALVARNLVYSGDTLQSVEYTMQVPVWLKTIDEDTSSSAGSGGSAPGSGGGGGSGDFGGGGDFGTGSGESPDGSEGDGTISDTGGTEDNSSGETGDGG
jgi:uncharacterized membrane protein YgcG